MCSSDLDAVFEFADFRNAVIVECVFDRATLVGAALDGAQGFDSRFVDVDFWAAEIKAFYRQDCDLTGARLPERAEVAFGPKGVAPPHVTKVPLYRIAGTNK